MTAFRYDHQESSVRDNTARQSCSCMVARKQRLTGKGSKVILFQVAPLVTEFLNKTHLQPPTVFASNQKPTSGSIHSSRQPFHLSVLGSVSTGRCHRMLSGGNCTSRVVQCTAWSFLSAIVWVPVFGLLQRILCKRLELNQVCLIFASLCRVFQSHSKSCSLRIYIVPAGPWMCSLLQVPPPVPWAPLSPER